MSASVGPVSYRKGAIFALAAVSIWAVWMPVTRLSVTTSLGPLDLAFLRFAVAGTLLLPVALRCRTALNRLRWWELLVLVGGAGAPYSLLVASGLGFAPAAHGGALTPGAMPMFAAILAVLVLGERVSGQRGCGYALIATGIVVIVGWNVLLADPRQSIGHGLFLAAAFMWASYTIVLRRSGLAPLDAASLVAVGSLLIFCPVYIGTRGLGFISAPAGHILFQAIFQGVVATIAALYCFGMAVRQLGASAAASFGALVPVLAALIAIPMLAELPAPSEWLGIFTVSAGVYLASGAALPARNSFARHPT